MTAPGENEPQTLKDAHAVASARRPKPGSNLETWLKFHQANARMYRAVSDVDRGHHHELRYWVGYEERKAEEVAAQIADRQSKLVNRDHKGGTPGDGEGQVSRPIPAG
ncbi:AMED_5909 family protein [Amycolatopsis sp. WAC 01416]|uniref:AMED_5909 family protein n=1 Tax=Amycolatopsis sp. WAC 01416 TaxID=2203196 RepID=UPI001F3DD6C7|nr:AMED_5909 family protein [Amycolatopsis sp. WAC 01416]